MQLIQYPQFRSGDDAARVVRTFHHAAGADGFTELDAATAERDFIKGNAFRNFTCHCAGCGEGNGFFYEQNLYVPIAERSAWASGHHTSTTHGASFTRNTADDHGSVATRGPHWALPHGPGQ